jgi:hypothetical protein
MNKKKRVVNKKHKKAQERVKSRRRARVAKKKSA